jgi:tetratricopeptide (TPR) repeat protein
MHGGETDRDSADELAEELGDLPLALEQARAYMERTGGTLSYYLGLYRDRFQELWQQDEPPQGYDQTIATTWSMSIGQLPQAAADLLNICAFFAPDDIPRELIAGAAVHLPEPLASVVSDVLVLDQAVAELRSYSLLEAGGDSWSAHRLVQGVVRGRLDNDDRNGWAEAAAEAMRAAFPYDSNEVENWPTCSRLLAHALAAASHSESQGVAADATGFILNQVSLYLRYRARFLEAKSALERAVKIGESELGSKDPMVATRLSSLGVILGLLGDSEGARNHIERAVNIHEAAYGLNHTQVANDLNNLGNVLMDLGDLEGARDHIQRAVNINEANGSNHQDFATQLYSLGNVLRELGDLDGAREHAQRAVEIDEAIYGPENPEVAKDLGNLGHVLRDLGDLDGAREHSQRALNILEAAYGPHHLDVGTASNHLAGVLWAIGDSEGAREHLQRSLGIYEEIFGLDHPNVAIILNNLGTILHDLGDVEGAREHMRRALDIARDSLGEEHPTTLLYRQNLESLSK